MAARNTAATEPDSNGFHRDRPSRRGTVAAQMVTSGQEVLAIDGQPVAELGLPRAELALRGVVGSTREIRFDSATLVLPVEELLPTP